MKIDFSIAAVLGVAAVAVLCDLRTRRIPNVLTFGAAAGALIFSLFAGGVTALGYSIAGWLVGAALFFPLFALGGMGAGDVKLLAALSAWTGPADAVWMALFASIAGGVIAIGVSLFHGYLAQAMRNVWLILMQWRIAGVQPVAGFTLKDNRAPRLAYAIPITIGMLCTLWRRQ